MTDQTPTERCALDVLAAARLLDDPTLAQQVLVFHNLASQRLAGGEEAKADLLVSVAALLAAVQDERAHDLERMAIDLDLDGEAEGAILPEDPAAG